jgi:hypothetical protein
MTDQGPSHHEHITQMTEQVLQTEGLRTTGLDDIGITFEKIDTRKNNINNINDNITDLFNNTVNSGGTIDQILNNFDKDYQIMFYKNLQ